MAKRRMFSMQIVDTDAFLEMPVSSQLLYFHLVMRADDEGFVGSPKKIMRLIGVQDDDLKVLIAKRFVLTFDSGVVVIKHWLIHNTIRMDRFNQTTYQDERSLLTIKENKSYTDNGNQMATNGCRKLSKVNLIKVNLKEKIKAFNNMIIPLKDGTKAKNYFGTWVDAENKDVKIDVSHYPELKQYDLS